MNRRWFVGALGSAVVAAGSGVGEGAAKRRTSKRRARLCAELEAREIARAETNGDVLGGEFVCPKRPSRNPALWPKNISG